MLRLHVHRSQCSLKKPHSINFTKKNDVHPFIDDEPLHFFSQKNDTSLFMVGAHQKKRPHTLTIGRTFDYRVLDMVELLVQEAKPLKHFKVGLRSWVPACMCARITRVLRLRPTLAMNIQTLGCGVGQKPLFMFSGEFFEITEEGRTLRNLLLDFYRGELLEKISLKGLEHVISVTADPGTPGRIQFRVYLVMLKKSATRVPRVELVEMGPRFAFKMGRTRLADAETWRAATKVSATLKVCGWWWRCCRLYDKLNSHMTDVIRIYFYSPRRSRM